MRIFKWHIQKTVRLPQWHNTTGYKGFRVELMQRQPGPLRGRRERGSTRRLALHVQRLRDGHQVKREKVRSHRWRVCITRKARQDTDLHRVWQISKHVEEGMLPEVGKSDCLREEAGCEPGQQYLWLRGFILDQTAPSKRSQKWSFDSTVCMCNPWRTKRG